MFAVGAGRGLGIDRPTQSPDAHAQLEPEVRGARVRGVGAGFHPVHRLQPAADGGVRRDENTFSAAYVDH